MKTIVTCATLMMFLNGFAHAGPREDCAASTGAKKGAAFNACVAFASKPAPKARSSGYGSGAARRGSCRMSGAC